MEVIRYLPDQHNGQIRDWLMARDMRSTLVDHLPEIGFIIPGIAAGFIRKVEGGMGLVDSFITNPEAPPDTRDKALNLLAVTVLKEAKDLGFIGLIALTRDFNTLTRGTTLHGYRQLEDVVMVHDLR